MSFASKYNRGKQFKVDTTGFKYVSLKELFEKDGTDYIYPLKAVYINTRGNYDDAPVFATDKFFVNIPSFMTDEAKEIISDKEAVEDINNGLVGFKIYTYQSEKYNKECLGVDFVDM